MRGGEGSRVGDLDLGQDTLGLGVRTGLNQPVSMWNANGSMVMGGGGRFKTAFVLQETEGDMQMQGPQFIRRYLHTIVFGCSGQGDPHWLAKRQNRQFCPEQQDNNINNAQPQFIRRYLHTIAFGCSGPGDPHWLAERQQGK